MQFQIEVGEITRTVVVQRDGERFKVAVNGRVHIVDARRLDATRLSLLVASGAADVMAADAARNNAVADTARNNTVADATRKDTVADAASISAVAADAIPVNLVRHIDAAIAAGREAGAFTISVNGQNVPVQMRTGGASRRGKEGSGATGKGPQRIVAPMPGKVVRVLVKPGDEVKAKQGLVVVEAMKMENELKAARAGRVRDVLATEGRSVDAGAVLVVVD